jgi:hypothetical protein
MRRTTHRSSSGKKLFAVRDVEGRFVDIQTYERAYRKSMKKCPHEWKSIHTLAGLAKLWQCEWCKDIKVTRPL